MLFDIRMVFGKQRKVVVCLFYSIFTKTVWISTLDHIKIHFDMCEHHISHLTVVTYTEMLEENEEKIWAPRVWFSLLKNFVFLHTSTTMYRLLLLLLAWLGEKSSFKQNSNWKQKHKYLLGFGIFMSLRFSWKINRGDGIWTSDGRARWIVNGSLRTLSLIY